MEVRVRSQTFSAKDVYMLREKEKKKTKSFKNKIKKSMKALPITFLEYNCAAFFHLNNKNRFNIFSPKWGGLK